MEPHIHHVNLSRYIQSTEGTHSLLVWIIIGLVAGYLTGKIMRGAGFGPIVDIIVGSVTPAPAASSTPSSSRSSVPSSSR